MTKDSKKPQQNTKRPEPGQEVQAGTDTMRTAKANALLADNRLRRQIIEAGSLGEPIWAMMMHLYVSDNRNKGVAAKSLCEIAELTEHTGLRMIKYLSDTGHVTMAVGAYPGETAVVLTSKTRKSVQTYLDATVV